MTKLTMDRQLASPDFPDITLSGLGLMIKLLILSAQGTLPLTHVSLCNFSYRKCSKKVCTQDDILSRNLKG